MGQAKTNQLLKPVDEFINDQGSTLTTHEMFQTLISMLSVELMWCNRLQDIVLKKQQVIIAGNVDELDRITGEEGLLTNQLGDRVKERAGLMKKIATCHGREMSEPRLRYLEALVPRDLSPALSKLIKQTETVAHQITETNQQNEYLLRASMDYARGMINLLYRQQGSDMTLYDTRGITDKNSTDTCLLDRKG
ncbi:MAG: flagellar protein FlgN [Candidatus Marinimicrobia bacterium]|nr:flagellar protein FlgN [Candidatus Neomarinimicrobiota bacterium]MCF7841128.1 flagellar protein FlgN [Candidatus Neomarinimicrobiota bacterium]